MQNEHNYLIHWLKKGQKAKYIDKVKLANGRWRYFYTQAEVDAYKRGLSKSAGSLADKAKQGLHNLKEGALNAGARVVVGASKKSQAVSNALGGEWKREAQQFTSDANKHQRTANSHNQKALASSAKAASVERFRRHGGSTIDGMDASAVEGRHREVSEKYARTSWMAAQKASNARRLAANAQKNYEQTTLGKAEARVRADDIRKSNEKNRKVPVREAVGKAIDRETSLRTKVSRAASKAKEAVADRAAEAVVGAANRSSAVRNAIGGQHQDNAAGWNRMADASQRKARAADRTAHEYAAKAASNERRNVSGAPYRRGAEFNREDATSYASNASTLRSKAADEQKAYENSLLGRAQARVNRKGKKSSSKKKSNRKKIRDGLYIEAQEAKIGR